MYKLITTMKRGSATGLAAAWARYPTMDAARVGTATLLRDDRILRVMIVRNEIPPAFVECAERRTSTTLHRRKTTWRVFSRRHRGACRC
jgi:hypothetical protein